MNALKRLLAAALTCLPLAALANAPVALDRAPIDNLDPASLQRGAKLFVNYCLNCHAAASMRYNRLVDIGVSEQQIKDNLMFATDKVGDPMKVSLDPRDAAKWFGAQPPDLSVIARSRGADWLYTYLRSFYRDESRPTGWNNVTFPNVGMPHVLWELQGQQELKHAETTGDAGHGHAAPASLVLARPGSLSPKEYDAAIADLVNYLVFQGEPARAQRSRTGILVLIFLGVLLVLAYALKKEYWKDVH